jgi:hypothetical protein
MASWHFVQRHEQQLRVRKGTLHHDTADSISRDGIGVGNVNCILVLFKTCGRGLGARVRGEG